MRDVLDQLVGWWEAGERVALATTVDSSSSSPREVGTAMLVGPDRSVRGSVSGGCVESDVYEQACAVLSTGVPVLRAYRAGDVPFAPGPVCGGHVEVFVERIDRGSFPGLEDLAAAVRDHRPVATVTCIDPAAPESWGRRALLSGDRVDGCLGTPGLTRAATVAAGSMLADGRSGTVRVGPAGVRVFVASFRPGPRLFVFGAGPEASALATIGRGLGRRVTICDARRTFADPRRFPAAHEVIVDWPHRYLRRQADQGHVDETSAVCALTHDPKFDTPLLATALRLPVAYVGAIGSRATVADRLTRLRQAGVSDAELARLRSPIGLDLGGREPYEIAVSIAAELVADRHGGTGARLTGAVRPCCRGPAAPR